METAHPNATTSEGQRADCTCSRADPLPSPPSGGSLPSSYLDPSCIQEGLETSLHPASHTADPTAFQIETFGKLERERRRVCETLCDAAFEALATGATGKHRRLRSQSRALEDCCRHPAIFYRPSDASFSLHRSRCRSRLCPLCGRLRAIQLKSDLLPLTRQLDSPKLLTLTLKSSRRPLDVELTRLIRCFAKLRRTKLWKETYKNGMYVIEVTWNPKTQEWHPHVHAIVSGTWVAHSDLVTAWKKTTGDSFIVDIRVAHSQTAAANYLTQYVSKAQDASRVPTDRLSEWALALTNKRLVSTFGGLRKIVGEEESVESEPDDSERLISLNVLYVDASNGDREAQDLLSEVKSALRSHVRPGDARPPPHVEAQNRQLAERLRRFLSTRNSHDEPQRADARSNQEVQPWLSYSKPPTSPDTGEA